MLPKDSKSYTLAFIIRNISRLLIYRDNWNRGGVMRKVIAEIIKSGLFSELYLGTEKKVFCGDDFPNHFDCAIINIHLTGLPQDNIEKTVDKELFVIEILNKKNGLKFSNKIINEQNNVSCIDIDIKYKEKLKLKKVKSE